MPVPLKASSAAQVALYCSEDMVADIYRNCVEIKAHEAGIHGERYTSGLKAKSELAGDVQWGKV